MNNMNNMNNNIKIKRGIKMRINRRTIRQKNMKTKRNNYTQKMARNNKAQLGGTKKNICEELTELKRFNTLDIFSYAIQLPKITK